MSDQEKCERQYAQTEQNATLQMSNSHEILKK